MPHELAKISNIDGDYVFLKVSKKTSCGECASKSSCGNVKLFKSVVENDVIKVGENNNKLDLKAGDSVFLALPSSKLLKGSSLVYLFPLCSMMFLAVLGKALFGEGMSIIAGLFGLASSLFWVRIYLSKKSVSEQFIPKILQKV